MSAPRAVGLAARAGAELDNSLTSVGTLGVPVETLLGVLGDWKATQGAISELRIDYGPGYRLYFTRRGRTVILLLCGGDKRTQSADIKRALKMVEELED